MSCVKALSARHAVLDFLCARFTHICWDISSSCRLCSRTYIYCYWLLLLLLVVAVAAVIDAVKLTLLFRCFIKHVLRLFCLHFERVLFFAINCHLVIVVLCVQLKSYTGFKVVLVFTIIC